MENIQEERGVVKSATLEVDCVSLHVRVVVFITAILLYLFAWFMPKTAEKIGNYIYKKTQININSVLRYIPWPMRRRLKGFNIKDYGSEGQQKNAIIAYKLTELEIFYQIRGNYPILILDDLFSELDRFKINNILNLINEDIQTFITTTEIDKINDNVLSNSKLFEVVDGYVREVNYEGRI